MKSRRQPEKLYVYECRGPSSPAGFPSGAHVLGIWPEPPHYYVFCRRESGDMVRGWLKERPDWELHSVYEMDYTQWQQVSSEDQRIGRFVVRGAAGHGEAALGPCDLPICIDPGIVFGSGVHPTTRACLLLLDELMGRFRPSTVVDFGTGTGILAVAASRLGADRIHVIDCNPLAVRLARENLYSNCPEQEAHFFVADDLGVLGQGVDLVVANIEWPSLKRLLANERGLRGHRFVILSGFLEAQQAEFWSLFPGASWKALRCLTMDGWMAVLAVNREMGDWAGELFKPHAPL